jgi:hypothetical protein
MNSKLLYKKYAIAFVVVIFLTILFFYFKDAKDFTGEVKVHAYTIKNQKCDNIVNSNNENFSFTVAGHIYGNPWGKNKGLYKPFSSFLDKCDYGSFVILTGDTVRIGDKSTIREVYNNIGNKGVKYFMTPGNHELTNNGINNLKEILNYKNTFYSWNYKNWHFISIDSNILDSKDQLKFIKNNLKNIENVNGIFIYTHDILWYEKFNVVPNNKATEKKVKIFYDEILPLLQKTKKPVYIFGGDVGADSRVKDLEGFFMGKEKNIVFISSGMGAGKDVDNVTKLYIYNDSKQPRLEIEKVMLNKSYNYDGGDHLNYDD